MLINLAYLWRVSLLALKGLPVTLGLSALSLAFSVPVGFFLAMADIYNIAYVKKLSRLYISFARGTPIILQILLVYSLIPSLLNHIFTSIGSGLDIFAISPFFYAFIVFNFNTTALMAELIRSALLTVDRGQLEAALSSGLNLKQAYRRIVLPQALVAAIPNMGNASVNLIKSTSLAFLMSVRDVTAIAKIEAAASYNYIEAYLGVFAIYLLVCGLAQAAFSLAEKRLGSYKNQSIAKAGRVF